MRWGLSEFPPNNVAEADKSPWRDLPGVLSSHLHSVCGALPLPWRGTFISPPVLVIPLLGSLTTHLVFNSILFSLFKLFIFPLVVKVWLLALSQKKASSNHLDHILDPPKTVKSRTKSFWIPPLRGKRIYTILEENGNPLWKGSVPCWRKAATHTWDSKAGWASGAKCSAQMPERHFF